MPFANSNDHITGRKPVPTPAGAEVLAVRFTLDLKTADLTLNRVGQIGVLPAGCIPLEVQVDCDDVDTGAAAMVLQVGIWDGAGAALSVTNADGGANWGSTTAVNTAFSQRLTRNGKAIEKVAPAAGDRKLGVLVATAPTTPAAGTLGVTLWYRAA